MVNEMLKCTVPNCRKALPPEAMWLPEWKALAAANGGKRVPASDFPKHALCGRHGHMLRKEGVRVYRYLESVARAKKEEDDRGSFKSFASRYVAKTEQDKAKKVPRADYGKVGMGLSRCAKKDAHKRLDSKQSEAPKPDAAPAPSA